MNLVVQRSSGALFEGKDDATMVVDPVSTPAISGDEARQWRSVRDGLRMLVAWWIALPFIAGVVVHLGALAAALRHDAPWMAAVALCLSVGGILCALVYAGIGIGRCCRAPAETGARFPLGAAIAFALLCTTLWLTWHSLEALWGTSLRGTPVYNRWVVATAAYGVIAGSFLMAYLSWLLFLRALATALGDMDLSRHVRNYALVFAAWAGIGMASLWMIRTQDRNPVLAGIAMLHMMLVFGHYFWMSFGLSAVAERIHRLLGGRDS